MTDFKDVITAAQNRKAAQAKCKAFLQAVVSTVDFNVSKDGGDFRIKQGLFPSTLLNEPEADASLQAVLTFPEESGVGELDVRLYATFTEQGDFEIRGKPKHLVFRVVDAAGAISPVLEIAKYLIESDQ